jgi:hypothetical protein
LLTTTSSYAGSVLPALMALGLGFGMIFAPAINTATVGVARQDSGVASALVNTTQQVGGSIGTAALSTVAGLPSCCCRPATGCRNYGTRPPRTTPQGASARPRLRP